MIRALSLFTAIALLTVAAPARSDVSDLPPSIMRLAPASMEQVGNGQYRKLGFNIYRVALWAQDGAYDRNKPFALQVHYTRSLDKETIVQAVVEDVRKQALADDATMDKWEAMLTDILPAVKDGDEIVGLYVPGKPAKLFFNGRQIASISDKRLSDSFFNIWLGPVANPELRAQLMGR